MASRDLLDNLVLGSEIDIKDTRSCHEKSPPGTLKDKGICEYKVILSPKVLESHKGP